MVLDTSFEIIRKIGKGSGGIVYEAFDKAKSQKIALKLTHILPSHEYLGDLLAHEFSVLSKLKHPHLAQVFDFGKEDNKFYFTSEWIEGPTLLDFAKEANLNTLFELLIQILRALDYLHQRGFLHLDIKPENILIHSPHIHQSLCCKLIDFGLSQIKDKFQTSQDYVYGTPPYTAPEMLLGEKAFPATDLYSFGMLCYRLFTQHFPFENADPIQMIQEQISRDLKITESPHPALPKSFSKVLEKLLRRKPKDRYQSAQEVIQAFNQSLEENFTLLPTTAPHSFLEESSQIFRKKLFDQIYSFHSKNPKIKIIIEGQEGLGKRRLIQFLKAKAQIAGFPFFKEDHITSNTKTFQLKPLSKSEVRVWLKHEIKKIPEKVISTLHQISKGFPTELENCLQILKNQDLIQWGNEAWSWKGPSQISWKKINAAKQKFWKEKFKGLKQILSLSPQGLNAQVIAGLLKVEENRIYPKLKEWLGQKQILLHRKDHLELYSLANASEKKNPSFSQSLKSLTKHFKKLYEQDRFKEACQWLDCIKEVPDKLILIAARHRVANRQANIAISLLTNYCPSQASKSLYHETLARTYIALGNTTKAHQEINKMESLHQSSESKIRRLNLEGKCLKLSGNFKEAEHFFSEGIDLAKKKRNSYLLGTLLMNLGTLYQDEGRFKKAQIHYKKALHECRKGNHPILPCLLLQNLAYLSYQMGNTRQAEGYTFDCLRIAVKNHFTEQQAISLNFMALFEGEKENHERQLHYLGVALHLLGSIPDSPWHCECLTHRAHVYWNLGKFFPAQLDTEKSLMFSISQKDPRREATARFLLGKILRDRENPDWKESKKQFELSLQLAKQSAHSTLLWEIYFEKALLEERGNEVKSAFADIKKSQVALEDLLNEMPLDLRWSYLKDRKLEKIQNKSKMILKKLIHYQECVHEKK